MSTTNVKLWITEKLAKKNTIGWHMVTTTFLLGSLMLLPIGCTDDNKMVDPWEHEVAQLRSAIEQFKIFETAQTVGYDIQATEYRTQMGIHFLNADLLDEKFEVEKPEVLIFINDPAGEMQLVAVEYGVPIQDINNPPPPPEGYTGTADVWKVDTEFNLWTLHVWVIMENPEGIFTPMNPMLP
jgi:hypothetical protein